MRCDAAAAAALLCAGGLAGRARAAGAQPGGDLQQQLAQNIPESAEIAEMVWALVGHNLEHQETFEESDVSQLMSEPTPLERRMLTNGAGFDFSGVMDLYETISSEYSRPPMFKRPAPPMFEYLPSEQLVAEWKGPSLGMQFTFGACESAGNKTLACVRPFMSLEKKPPSFEWSKGEKIFNYTKPGAIFADKRCNFGGGEATKKEQAVLYDGGSETYDLSGFLWDTPKMFSSTEMFKSREQIEAMGFEIFDDNHARSLSRACPPPTALRSST